MRQNSQRDRVGANIVSHRNTHAHGDQPRGQCRSMLGNQQQGEQNIYAECSISHTAAQKRLYFVDTFRDRIDFGDIRSYDYYKHNISIHALVPMLCSYHLANFAINLLSLPVDRLRPNV